MSQIFLIDPNRPSDRRYTFAKNLRVAPATVNLSKLRIAITMEAPLPMEFLLDEDAATALVNGIAQILVLDGGHMIYVTELDALPSHDVEWTDEEAQAVAMVLKLWTRNEPGFDEAVTIAVERARQKLLARAQP